MPETKDNALAYCEGFSCPDGEYAWTAKISHEPTAQGLGGGRIQYLNVHKWEDGSDHHVARFQGGALLCDNADAHITQVLADIAKSFDGDHIQNWVDHFPGEQDRQEIKISRAGPSRGDTGGRER